MRKRCVLLVIIQLLAFICSACFGGIDIDISETNSTVNSGNNILHGGYVAKQGDSVFYAVRNDDFFRPSGLFVSKHNKKKKIVSGNMIDSINIHGDTIYYIKQEKTKINSVDQFTLYKYKISEEKEERLLQHCDNAVSIDGQIYFKVYFDEIGYKKANQKMPDAGENNFIKVLNSNTMEIDIVVDKPVDKFTVIKDKLYYQYQDQIFMLDLTNKSERVLIQEQSILDFQISEDALYCLTYDYATGISKVIEVSLNENNSRILFSENEQLYQIVMYADHLYFLDNKENCYKINADGASQTLISGNCSSLFAFQNALYSWHNEVEQIDLTKN